MGAFHKVPVYLDQDINVLELKKIEKVQAYLKVLYAQGPRAILRSLSTDMEAPVAPPHL